MILTCKFCGKSKDESEFKLASFNSKCERYQSKTCKACYRLRAKELADRSDYYKRMDYKFKQAMLREIKAGNENPSIGVYKARAELTMPKIVRGYPVISMVGSSSQMCVDK